MDWELLDIANDFMPGVTPPDSAEISYHIVISDDEILTIESAHTWRPLNQDEWRWSGLDATVEHYLGNSGGVPIFACEVDPDIENPPGYEFDTLWSFLGRVDEATFNLIGRARQIVEWHRNHQYCGRCGKPTELSANDRSRVCGDCEQTFYPRLSPSIIVLITRGEELLLARNVHARGNFYSTLAGFIEPGESIEDTVHREVFEEVGIRIKNLQYFGSQSWPFPNSLMLGFHAEYDSGELVLQEDEIADAQWFHYENLPHHPAMVSISGWLIDDYIKRLNRQT
jgi:NAD+ diphosphatase